jgi:hypothetical protein
MFLGNVIIAHFDKVPIIKTTIKNIESPWTTNSVKVLLEMHIAGLHSDI